MSNSIQLDPNTLPVLDIVELANTGAIRRAEQQTPPDGIPVFVTALGWLELEDRYGIDNPRKILRSLESAAHRLLSHAATTLATQSAGEVSATITCPSDLFTENGSVNLSFVRDREHPVVCVLIGTTDHLMALLSPRD